MKKIIVSIICLITFICVGLVGYQVWYKGTLSPIEDVSKKTYVENMKIIDEYLDPNMRSDIKESYEQGTTSDQICGATLTKLDKLITEKSTDSEKLLIDKTKEIIGVYDACISTEIWMDGELKNSSNIIAQIAITSSQKEYQEKMNAVINTAHEALKNARNKEDLEAITTDI